MPRREKGLPSELVQESLPGRSTLKLSLLARVPEKVLIPAWEEVEERTDPEPELWVELDCELDSPSELWVTVLDWLELWPACPSSPSRPSSPRALPPPEPGIGESWDCPWPDTGRGSPEGSEPPHPLATERASAATASALALRRSETMGQR